jgi:hypothetical protein
MPKSLPVNPDSPESVGRSYYCFCLEQALMAICHARALVEGDAVDTNHELPLIQRLLQEALEAS